MTATADPQSETTNASRFKAKDLLNILLAECDSTGVQIHTQTSITSVLNKTGGGFTLATSMGQWGVGSLVIATGGLSIPTLGATGFGYDIASQFGLRGQHWCRAFEWNRRDIDRRTGCNRCTNRRCESRRSRPG